MSITNSEMNSTKTDSKEQNVKANGRLVSLDALRGFDMFWIISGEGIFHGLAQGIKQNYGLVQNTYNWQIEKSTSLSFIERLLITISNQLHHSPWNGFTFYDLIFPLFIFISGVSMPFSYQRYLDGKVSNKGGGKQIYMALIKRTITLIILGFIVNGLLKWNGYENTRFASVLGRIALSTFFAAIIYLNFSLPKQLIWFAFILIGYYLLMVTFPVPGFGSGVLTPEGNFAAYFDRLFLPGKLHRIIYDPEGLMSTVPSICSAMMGIFTGTFIKGKSATLTPLKKMGFLLAAGCLCICLGLLWSGVFPINKITWTSSFVLFAGGWSLILFSLFYFLFDICPLRKWCLPFIWIGSNSILIYICAHGLVNFESSSSFLFGGLITKMPPEWQQAGLWTGVLIIQLFLLKILYDKKWFLKI